MKFRFKAILAALLFSAVPIALAQDAATDVKKGAETTGHETKVVAKDTAKGTEKVADKTGHATKVVAKDTAKGTEKAADKTGHETKVVAKDTAKGTEKAADKTGHETKVVAKDTAKGTEKVAKKTGSVVKKGAKDTGHEMKKVGGGDKPADLPLSRSNTGVVPGSKGHVRVCAALFFCSLVFSGRRFASSLAGEARPKLSSRAVFI